MIPLDKCENRRLYLAKSRNLNKVAVFDKATKSFFGLRTKFGNVFIDNEYHWDTGEPHGTCNAINVLDEILPKEIKLKLDLGSMCSNCNKLVKYDMTQSIKINGRDFPGQWIHLEETECKEISPCSIYNQKLYDWLKNMEEKYERLYK
jgi:hypothetical protein